MELFPAGPKIGPSQSSGSFPFLSIPLGTVEFNALTGFFAWLCTLPDFRESLRNLTLAKSPLLAKALRLLLEWPL